MIVAKKQNKSTKTCADCIHESACRIWTDGRLISDASASVCPNHETVKESAAYLCGVLDERKREKTNADSIRAMSDEELAQEMIFFCPTDTVFKGTETYEKPHYTGLDGSYYSTSEELTAANLVWLQKPAEGEMI